MAKVLLGMASSDYVRTRTAGMMYSLAQAFPDMKLVVVQGPYVDQNREAIATDFLASDCTHLFFVDSDMLFKPEVLTALLANDKEIVGAQYNRRIEREGVHVAPTRYDLPGMETPNRPFVNQVVATGCLLIKREVFEKIPQPWFATWEDGRRIGEDVFFCRKAKEHGISSWIDPTLQVFHIGEKMY